MKLSSFESRLADMHAVIEDVAQVEPDRLGHEVVLFADQDARRLALRRDRTA